MTIKRKKTKDLDLGCGPTVTPHHVGIDILTYNNPHIIQHDLSQGLPVTRCRDVRADNLMEHLPIDALHVLMRDIEQKMVPGGILFIGCPHFTSPCYHYSQHHGHFGCIDELRFWCDESPEYSDYNGRYAFRIKRIRLRFNLKFPWNWVVMPLVNTCRLVQRVYENTFLCYLFPAVGLHVWYEKK